MTFVWLDDAKIVNTAYNCTEPNLGLRMSSERNTLKLYMGDTGLLVSLAYDESEKTRTEVQRLILYGKLEANLGMVMENLVGRMIVASGRKLYFYAKSDNDDADERMEVDFLVAKNGVGRRHNISAIEVKKTKRIACSSLTKFKAKFALILCPRANNGADFGR